MFSKCPFCSIDPSRIIIETELVFCIRDGYPISPGHTLIIPRRHILSFFDTFQEERTALFQMLFTIKETIASELQPDGYNIGINDGPAAGQTVPHLHIHVIPRYHGDRPDQRGGVRWIFPDKADYWSK